MAESRKREMTFSSEQTVVQRWFGGEQLDHSPGAVRMDFMKSGRAPLLLNHDMRQQVGVVDQANIGNDRKGHAEARFGRSQPANDALANVDDRILVNTSVGYRVHEMQLVNSKDEEDTYRVIDWEPYEVSLVAVPADPVVGVGRGIVTIAVDVQRDGTVSSSSVSTTAQNAIRREAMTEQVVAAAGTSAGSSVEVTRHEGSGAVEAEGARVRGIDNLCKGNNIDGDIRSRWVSGGSSMETVSEELMKILKSRGEKNHTVSDIGLSNQEVRQFSLTRAIKACADQNWGDAGLEAEASQTIAKKLGQIPDKMRFYVPAEIQRRDQKRDLTVGTASAGGYLVETANVSFIELLRNASVALKMGITRLSGLVGSITVPKQTGAGTNYWLSTEATAITEGNQTFGQMALSPKTAGAYTEISRQLLLQSSPAVEGLITNDLAQVVGLAVDLAVLNGSGSSGQPTGIIQTAGIGAFTGTSLAAAGVLDAQSDVAGANALKPGCGYVTTAAVAALLMARPELPSTGTTRLWKGNMAEGTMFDFPAMTSPQMSTATALFGLWPSVVLAEWGVLQVEVNPYANFAAGIVGVRAMYSIDVGVRYAGAWSYSSSIT